MVVIGGNDGMGNGITNGVTIGIDDNDVQLLSSSNNGMFKNCANARANLFRSRLVGASISSDG